MAEAALSASVRVAVDLTGSKLGPDWRSVDLVLDPPGDWTDDRIRRGAADHYGVTLDQVGPVRRRGGEQLLDALLLTLASTDGSLLEDDVEVQHLFDRGLLTTRRDFADEYVTELTLAGREFVLATVREAVADGQ